MRIETAFEAALWKSRFLTLIAVVASVVVAFGVFLVAAVDVIHLAASVTGYVASGGGSSVDSVVSRPTVIAHVVTVLDGLLLGSVLLIFAFGLYGIFIGPIEIARGAGIATGLLSIATVDELKDRLAKIIILILMVHFFERTLTVPVDRALDLLWMAVGIVLIAFAAWLSHRRGTH